MIVGLSRRDGLATPRRAALQKVCQWFEITGNQCGVNAPAGVGDQKANINRTPASPSEGTPRATDPSIAPPRRRIGLLWLACPNNRQMQLLTVRGHGTAAQIYSHRGQWSKRINLLVACVP